MKPNFRKDIHILNTDSVRNFKEITDLYPGKVIFIDVWATCVVLVVHRLHTSNLCRNML